MSDAVLYGLFKQIPNATDEQIEKAVESIASTKDVATKSDLRIGLAELETRLVKQLYHVAGIIVVANAVIMGLLIRFL